MIGFLIRYVLKIGYLKKSGGEKNFMAIYLYEFLDTPKYPKSHKKAT
jgi:hypothetical protein